MKEGPSLLATLDRLFAGPREATFSVDDFLRGLEARSYAFVVAALDLPNCIPTGIPLLSTVTGVPMLLVLVQAYLGRPAPELPRIVGRRALPRGRLQDFLARARPHIGRLERAIHPRHERWVTGLPCRLLQGAWSLLIVLLALPIPFDNLLPAWAILFFCFALLERDGVMAMLGWLASLVTLVWTILLTVAGPYVVMQLVRNVI